MVVRSSRVLLLAMLLASCGGERAAPRLVLQWPGEDAASVPFPLAVVRGRTTAAEALRLEIHTGEHTYAFPAARGWSLAFWMDEGREQAVRYPGPLDAPPGADDMLRALRGRLAEARLPARVREPARGRAFVVDVEGGRDDALASVVRLVAGQGELRFLLEVLPVERYRFFPDEETSPRLREPPHPWPGNATAFDAYKEAEVERFVEARAAGRPYRPSREDMLVLPRHGTPERSTGDFLVLEWPAEEGHRFDGGMLENALVSRDERLMPVVLYDVKPAYRDAFEAWTRANVGLPLAIVFDDRVRSAPVIRDALRESVQVTTGTGPRSEQEREVESLAQALSAGDAVRGAALVAAVRWEGDGEVEVLLPLEERAPTRLALEIGTAADEAAASIERTLRLAPGVEVEADVVLASTLGAMLLGRLDAEEAAVRLRGWLPASLDGLVAILRASSDDGATVARRRLAARLLGRVDAEAAAAGDALVRALGDPDPGVREEAATSLEGLAPRADLLEGMRRALDAVDDEAAPPVLRAIGSLGVETDGVLATLLDVAAHGAEPSRWAAEGALEALLPEAREPLRAAADADDGDVRAAAVRVLARGGWGEDVIAFLVAKAKDTHPRVRLAATDGLLMHALAHPPAALPHLDDVAALLADEEEGVRTNAAAVLGGVGEAAVPVLLASLADERAGVRQAALAVFAQMETVPEAVIAAEREALAGGDPVLRLYAAFALLRHGGVTPDEVRPVVEEGLASADAAARRAAAYTVHFFASSFPETAARLRTLLDDDDERVRRAAAAALERMGEADERTRAILAED